MNLVLLGPPGAGKGTQAVRIARECNLSHLSSGDILREERKSKTELGQAAQEYMDRGDLVPDNLIIEMMMDRIANLRGFDGFLLDGFPRTRVQSEGLDSRLKAAGESLDAVISIEVDEDRLVERLTGRLYCPSCGRTYHLTFSPPARAGICDHCGDALIRRKDDSPEVVRQRLATYKEQTRPLVAYYGDRGLLRTVSGVGEIDTVTQRIKEACQA